MDIVGIIVNYRTADATIVAVKSLLSELDGLVGSKVLVVDNDSRDGSSQQLKDAFAGPAFSDRVTIIDAGHNGGYGFGINAGVQHALAGAEQPRFLYVINPDACADPGSVKRLLAFADAHPDAGLVGSLVHGTEGDVQAKAFRFPSLWSELEGTAHVGVLSRLLHDRVVALYPTESREVDWVPGTSMLIRREVFATAGYFDPGFFLYLEEVDFARRTRAAGWKVYFVVDAGIAHIGSLATGLADESRRMPRYWFQARRRYFVKHHGRLYGAACDGAWIAGQALYLAKVKVLGRAAAVRPNLWRDFVRYSVSNLWKPAPEADENRSLRAR